MWEKLLTYCEICPRLCRINRTKETGFCRTNSEIKIASYNLHFGEEPPISGKNGSGTIFFTGCHLRCPFCQNYPISQLLNGYSITPEKLLKIFFELQEKGAHNINLVTPTHYIARIAPVIQKAKKSGLKIPLVYNSSGYERPETIRRLAGLIDIYLPDAKYGTDDAGKISGVNDYATVNQRALREMWQQVGDLKIKNGLAVKGLIVRHLILPDNLARTEKVLEFIAREISPDTYLSLMAQYHPAYLAAERNFPQKSLRRRLTIAEYNHFVDRAISLGLNRVLTQAI